jgi:hypothetical protein
MSYPYYGQPGYVPPGTTVVMGQGMYHHDHHEHGLGHVIDHALFGGEHHHHHCEPAAAVVVAPSYPMQQPMYMPPPAYGPPMQPAYIAPAVYPAPMMAPTVVIPPQDFHHHHDHWDHHDHHDHHGHFW